MGRSCDPIPVFMGWDRPTSCLVEEDGSIPGTKLAKKSAFDKPILKATCFSNKQATFETCFSKMVFSNSFPVL